MVLDILIIKYDIACKFLSLFNFSAKIQDILNFSQIFFRLFSTLPLLKSNRIVQNGQLLVGEFQKCLYAISVVGGAGHCGQTYRLAVEVDILTHNACIDAPHAHGVVVGATKLLKIDNHE